MIYWIVNIEADIFAFLLGVCAGARVWEWMDGCVECVTQSSN